MNVCLEVRSCCAGEFTLFAIERPVYWMCPHVCLEGDSLCAGEFALCAAEWLFSWMGDHVFLEVTSCCAGVPALFTNKRLLSTVNQHVAFQIRSYGAWVAALVATVGLLSIMVEQLCVFRFLAISMVLRRACILGTPSEIKTGLSGKNSQVGRPPSPSLGIFSTKSRFFSEDVPKWKIK